MNVDDSRWSRSPLFEEVSLPSPDRAHAVTELSRLVVESHEFIERELACVPVASRYRLRDSGLFVCLRHGTRDLGIFDEIFQRRFYELPSRVATLLGSLDHPVRVLDLGGNIGLFGVYVLGMFPTARITAFEPDRFNFDIHARCIESNDLAASWRLVKACAAESGGRISFRDGEFSGSRIASPEERSGATTVPAVDILPYLPNADLLKVDIEGGEWRILSDTRLGRAGLKVIAMEYHPYLCATGDPRATAERLLRQAGYVTDVLFDRDDGVGMLWAWRP